MQQMHGTTILGIRKNNKIAIAGDGQVSLQHTVVKDNAIKIRRIYNDKVVTGFAGATADAFTLFEKFEGKLQEFKGDLKRAAVEMTREWRSDKILRKLEAMIIVADEKDLLLLSGTGDVLEPHDDVIAIGSGGNYALSAAKALKDNTNLEAKDIARKSVEIAADICIYTNKNIIVQEA